MQITIRDSGDLKAAARALRRNANAKELRKEFTQAINAEMTQVVVAVRAAYTGGEHLRPALRRATRKELRTTGRQAGARIRVDGRKMPSGMGSVPAMREGYVQWRHPVFGRDTLVTQAPHPVFDAIVRPFTERVRRRIDQTGTQIANRIVRG